VTQAISPTDCAIDEQCVRELVFAMLDVLLAFFVPEGTGGWLHGRVDKIFEDARTRNGIKTLSGAEAVPTTRGFSGPMVIVCEKCEAPLRCAVCTEPVTGLYARRATHGEKVDSESD
jgi:hypothetical protein